MNEQLNRIENILIFIGYRLDEIEKRISHVEQAVDEAQMAVRAFSNGGGAKILASFGKMLGAK